MTVSVTPFLRNVLRADAAMGAAAAVLCIAGRNIFAELTALPADLLFWAGIALVPVAIVLFAMSRLANVSRLVLIDIVAINALWTLASFALLAGGWIAPNALGVAFVVVQALAVGAFATLEAMPLRAGRTQAA